MLSFLLLAFSVIHTVHSFSASNTAIDFNNAAFENVNKGNDATAVAGAVTMNSQAGVITSSTADLTGYTADTITVTNSLCATTSIVLVNVQSPCAINAETSNVVVAGVTTAAGSFAVEFYNAANYDDGNCESTYSFAFLILN